MKTAFACAGVLGLVLGVSAGAAQAQETGLAAMHDMVRVGGKTCMTDHFHDGVGMGASRAQAQRAAIQSWIDFTAFEYGGRWGRYSIAASKSMSCSGGGGSYSCSTSARPCRY
jgi:hypothetical protein